MGLFGKGDQERIDGTVATIVNLCPAIERQTVRAFLTKWIAANFGSPVMRKVFSEGLSTHGYAGRGDEATRAARRALVILRGDLLNPANPLHMSADAVMSMPTGQVAQALADMMLPFRTYALQEERVRTLLGTAFNSLKTSPQLFLTNNIVVCQSWGNPPGGVLRHRFVFNYKDQVYMMLPPAMLHTLNDPAKALEVDAVNVPELYWGRLPKLPNGQPNWASIDASTLTGADIMVTSAFSGCSFCFKNNGGSVYAAHISPATTTDPSIGPPPTLANHLINSGNFGSPAGATAGALQVYGRGASNLVGHALGYAVNPVPGVPLIAASMYIFGLHIGGGWQIWGQENNNGAKTVTQLL